MKRREFMALSVAASAVMAMPIAGAAKAAIESEVRREMRTTLYGEKGRVIAMIDHDIDEAAVFHGPTARLIGAHTVDLKTHKIWFHWHTDPVQLREGETFTFHLPTTHGHFQRD